MNKDVFKFDFNKGCLVFFIAVSLFSFFFSTSFKRQECFFLTQKKDDFDDFSEEEVSPLSHNLIIGIFFIVIFFIFLLILFIKGIIKKKKINNSSFSDSISTAEEKEEDEMLEDIIFAKKKYKNQGYEKEGLNFKNFFKKLLDDEDFLLIKKIAEEYNSLALSMTTKMNMIIYLRNIKNLFFDQNQEINYDQAFNVDDIKNNVENSKNANNDTVIKIVRKEMSKITMIPNQPHLVNLDFSGAFKRAEGDKNRYFFYEEINQKSDINYCKVREKKAGHFRINVRFLACVLFMMKFIVRSHVNNNWLFKSGEENKHCNLVLSYVIEYFGDFFLRFNDGETSGIISYNLNKKKSEPKKDDEALKKFIEYIAELFFHALSVEYEKKFNNKVFLDSQGIDHYHEFKVSDYCTSRKNFSREKPTKKIKINMSEVYLKYRKRIETML